MEKLQPVLKVGILGASGLMGLQLLQILSQHPCVGAITPFSRRYAGKPVGSPYPMLKNLKGVRFQRADRHSLASCDSLFCALPHGKLGKILDTLPPSAAEAFVIDLGSDFRIRDVEVYQKVYGKPHPFPQYRTRFVQVVPEINGHLCREAKWVTLPGCVSTAALLGLYPLFKMAVLAAPFVNIDAKVGSTGAGSSRVGHAQTHFLRINGVKVHRLLSQHRHSYELAEYCREAGMKVSFHVNSFSVDMARGIACAAYFETVPGMTVQTLHKIYREHYRECPGIRIMRQHTGGDRYPNPRYLAGTNLCDIGFEVDPESSRGVMVSAIDNLIRGGSGQAVQVFNLQHGFDRDLGLCHRVLYP